MADPFSPSAARWPRLASLALVLGVVVYAFAHPDGLGSNGSLLDRLFGALLIVGAIGAALDGLGWESERRYLRLVADRRFAWPAILAGATWGLIGPGIA